MAGGKKLRESYQPFFRQVDRDPSYPEGQSRILVDTIEEFAKLAYKLITENIKFIACDTETSGLDAEEDIIVGVSFATSMKESYYIPVGHKIGNNIPIHLVLELIAELNKKLKYIFFYNSRFDIRMLNYAGLEEYVKSEDLVQFDVASLVFNADTNMARPTLKWACLHYVGWEMRTFTETLEDNPDFSYLDPKICYEYACDDALGTFALVIKLGAIWDEAKAITIVDSNLNIPLMRMEDDPLYLDLSVVDRLKEEVGPALANLEIAIYRATKFQFKINSPDALNGALEHLGIETLQKTPTGKNSTKEDALQQVAHLHPMIEKVIEYKKLLKLESGYLDPLVNNYRKDLGGARFAYHVTAVPTGRLAAGKPSKKKATKFFAKINIQSIPKPKGSNFRAIPSNSPEAICGYIFEPTQEETGIEGYSSHLNIRETFKAPEGYYWAHADYKGQELRLPANMSGEPVLIKVFTEGGDFHEVMAIKIFGEHNSANRKKVKPVNFGALFGGSEWTFSRELSVSLKEADDILTSWWKSLPVLKAWVENLKRSARKEGVVYTFFGRPRRVRFWYQLGDYRNAAFADRTAVSHRVQGSGGDIMRYIICKIYRDLKEWIDQRILLPKISVHDELNFYIRQDMIEPVMLAIKNIMELPIKGWKVPMEVGLDIGTSWGKFYTFSFKEGKLVPGK